MEIADWVFSIDILSNYNPKFADFFEKDLCFEKPAGLTCVEKNCVEP
jgi:hypothetical protein